MGLDGNHQFRVSLKARFIHPWALGTPVFWKAYHQSHRSDMSRDTDRLVAVTSCTSDWRFR